MLSNHLKLIWRSLLKNKTTSFINFTGLTIGIATAVFIGLYVANEKQTDKALPHPDRTFRVLRISEIDHTPYDIGITSAPFAPALKQDFPADVEETIRVLPGNSLIHLGDKRFQEDKYYYADANFLTFFGLELAAGDPKTALSQPHHIVLTAETARRYFGDEFKAMGQTFKVDNDYEATVSGVLADNLPPMHLDFDLVESTLSLEEARFWTGWWNNTLCTYVRLTPGASASALESRLPGFMDKYFGKDFERTGSRIDLRLQAVRDIYFESDTRYDPMRHGNPRAVQVFLLAAILLIVIACANYVNLSTAKAVERSREIGVYKILGSGRRPIIQKMLGESLLVTLVSALAATQLVAMGLPWFEQLFGVELQLNLTPWKAVVVLGSLVVATGLIAGWYPGWLLSSFKPALVLKGNVTAGERRTAGLRTGLVVFQFVLSVGLLCSTLIIRQQLDYLADKDLGFDRDHVLLMNINNREAYRGRDILRQRLKQEPGVQEVSFMDGIPGGHHDATTVDAPELNRNFRMRTAFVDFDFVSTLGLQLIAGRDFDPRLASDSARVAILNEQAVADLGVTPEAALGKKIHLASFDTIPREVIGVVRDYHFSSLHDAIEPLVVTTAFHGRVMAIKASGDRLAQAITAAEKAWNEISPDYPFTFQFLDERLDRLYQTESRQGRIFALFAGIAILIASLGMCGLAAYAASRRTKEIGIRKVVGATATGIVGLLSRDFLKPVLVALVIATPLAWYFMENWLDSFSYRVEIRWWVFALAGLIAVLIAFLTVSYQSVKAALANPASSLKSE